MSIPMELSCVDQIFQHGTAAGIWHRVMVLLRMQVIVEKMIEYLRTANDDLVKADIVKRVSDLAERFAPDTQWFIETMNQVWP